MGVEKNNKQLTAFLKGLAILSVIINHFLNIYITDHFQGLANGFIAIFFVLSGYGLYCSQSRDAQGSRSQLSDYYLKRILRIYPLYWASLIFTAWSRNDWQIMSSFLLPDSSIQIIYWFLNALIQCYLVAPLFFLLARRLNPPIFLLVNLAALFIINGLLHVSGFESGFLVLKYRFVGAGHLFLFSMGILIAKLRANQLLIQSSPRAVTIFSFLFFLSMMVVSRKPYIYGKYPGVLFSLLFLFSVALFCFFTLQHKNEHQHLFPMKLFRLMGGYSFSLYLFHLDYFRVLYANGLFQTGLSYGIIFVVMLFPLFFMICLILEQMLRRSTDWTYLRMAD